MQIGLALEIVVGAAIFWHRIFCGNWKPAAPGARRHGHLRRASSTAGALRRQDRLQDLDFKGFC